MIQGSLRLWECQGTKVHVVFAGRPATSGEEIYYEEIEKALRSALRIAGERVAAAGLGAPLTPQFIEALEGKRPAPLGPDAVEVKLPGATPMVPEARPPLFSDFIAEVQGAMQSTLDAERARAEPSRELIASIEAAQELIRAQAEIFGQRMIRWHRAREKEYQRGGN